MITAQLTALYRRSTRALGAISTLFVVGLALSLVGAVWLAIMNRATASLDLSIQNEGARLAQNVLLAERSYERYLMTGEADLLAAHREADAGITASLGRLDGLAAPLARWGPGLPGGVREVRSAVDAWRSSYVSPAITGRLSHLWQELEIFHSNKGEAAWVTRLDRAMAALRLDLTRAAAAREQTLEASHRVALGITIGGVLLQALALIVLVPAVVHGLGRLRDRGRLAVSLMDAAEMIQDSPDEETIARTLADSVVRDAGASAAVVLFLKGNRFAEAAAAGRSAASPGSPVLDEPARCPVAATSRPHLVGNVLSARACACPLGVPARGGYACYPVTSLGRVHGVFNVQAASRLPLRAEHLQDHFGTLARIASMAINAQQVLARAQRDATTDALTGAYNRRYLEASLLQLLHSARRRRAPLAVLMLDLDFFKAFNDAHGHPAGDALLEVFGRVAREALRKEDVFARYGGEEFVAVLPNTDKEVARQVAERIREGARNLFIPGLPHLPRPLICVSIGISAYPENGESDQELLGAADGALYQAKGAGRDRVLVS